MRLILCLNRLCLLSLGLWLRLFCLGDKSAMLVTGALIALVLLRSRTVRALRSRPIAIAVFANLRMGKNEAAFLFILFATQLFISVGTVCFLLFARPVLLRLGGFAWPSPVAVPLPAAFALTKRIGRSEYLRARLVREAAGGLQVQKIARQGSGILTSMVEAEGLVELDAGTERVEPGQPVPFLSFAELGIPT